MTYQPLQLGSLDRKSWEMILLALETYVINKETQLIKENAGDEPWRDLDQYNTLIRDIQLYIIK
jgi:hypothetical protein